MRKLPRTGSRRRAVLRLIAKAGKRGITDEELGMQLVLSPADIGKARLELLEGNWIMDANTRRRTSFGDEAIVWRLTPDGKQKWDESKSK